MRPEQRLHGWQEPAATRPAATVLLVRDSAGGLEVLMTRRSSSATFAPGAYVFPGGVVDVADGDAITLAMCRPRPSQSAEQLPFCVAAVREAFEEVGVLLANDAAGAPIDASVAAELSRVEPLLPALAARGWRPAVEQLYWLSHWVTDRDMPKRFDVRFYVAPMPAGFEPHADNAEIFAPEWVQPANALARHDRGEFHMIFPTIRTLRQLSRFARTADLLEHCERQQQPAPICPRAGLLREQIERFTQDEPPFGELDLVAPDGRVVHRLDWQHEQPVALTRSVVRLTAPNASIMTGPGTNSYIVGNEHDCVVIDPGPADEMHVGRLAALVKDRLRWILCTHSHPDHSPGARLLQQITGVPILGMRSSPGVPQAWAFAPDRELTDGERVSVGNCTLRAVHTPGHMSNHLCFVLEEDGLLFSGDHILNGSTTVVDPVDGDMSAYLASLTKLRAEQVDYILPAHGHVLAPAGEAMDRLIAHRLMREAKVRAALDAHANSTLSELVPSAYDDVPPTLHRVAERSLHAHLIKLVRDGVAVEKDGRWRPAA